MNDTRSSPQGVYNKVYNKGKKKFTIKDTWTLITELGVQNAMIDTKHEVPPEARKIGHLHFMEICVGFM